jgi:Virulence factor BrkB
MALMGIALALIVALPAITGDWPTALRWSALVLRFVLLALLPTVGLAVLYRFAPDRENPRWSWVSWGSAVATLLWVVASLAFSFYVSHFANYNKTYGALAGIIILMFWLFLTAFMVLLGAELNTEMELQTARDTTTGRRPSSNRTGRPGAASPGSQAGHPPAHEPLQKLLGVEAKTLEQVGVLVGVHLVGELLVCLAGLVVLAALPEQVEDRVLVDLHALSPR